MLARSHEEAVGAQDRLQSDLGRFNKTLSFFEGNEARLMIRSKFLFA